MKTTIIIIQTITLFLAYVYFGKYIPLEYAFQQVKWNEYKEDYKCVEFTYDLIAELEKVGIQAKRVSGINEKGENHSWVSIWIEPQHGNFSKDYKLRSDKIIN